MAEARQLGGKYPALPVSQAESGGCDKAVIQAMTGNKKGSFCVFNQVLCVCNTP